MKVLDFMGLKHHQTDGVQKWLNIIKLFFTTPILSTITNLIFERVNIVVYCHIYILNDS